MAQESEGAVAREDNALLAALPTRERNDAHRSSQLFTLEFGAKILEADTRSQHAYFPIRGVVSLIRTLSSGPTVEVGVVGNEGMVGVDIFMDAPTQLNDAIVQGQGSAWRMSAEHLLVRFQRNGRCSGNCCGSRTRSSLRSARPPHATARTAWKRASPAGF
jgi:CRP-like cAMP-binding protein